jgi:hypothetical protein
LYTFAVDPLPPADAAARQRVCPRFSANRVFVAAINDRGSVCQNRRTHPSANDQARGSIDARILGDEKQTTKGCGQIRVIAFQR